METKELLAQANAIIIACKFSQVTYDEAKAQCEPLLKEVNERIIILAKKHGQKPFKITFTSLLR